MQQADLSPEACFVGIAQFFGEVFPKGLYT
jgi:hypothetical protein